MNTTIAYILGFAASLLAIFGAVRVRERPSAHGQRFLGITFLTCWGVAVASVLVIDAILFPGETTAGIETVVGLGMVFVFATIAAVLATPMALSQAFATFLSPQRGADSKAAFAAQPSLPKSAAIRRVAMLRAIVATLIVGALLVGAAITFAYSWSLNSPDMFFSNESGFD